VTRQSIREYASAIRDRYWQNRKEGKTKILDEFTKTTGLHRKAAIRLLNKETAKHSNKKRERPRQYSHEAIEVLKTAWAAEDRICSKRLPPFLNDLVKILKKNNDIKVTHIWCWREGLTFTRSRSYKKNDSCHIEQKNGALVRRIIG
jgi:hypothetical protein